MRSERMVSESTPRASRAAMLLPANRSAFTATARAIGMPFQCVISTPAPNGGRRHALGDPGDEVLLVARRRS